MGLGPIELIVVGFPGNRFTGGILPELQRLVDEEIITIVDGLVIRKDETGNLEYLEIEQLDPGDDVAPLAQLLDEADGLLSEDDVYEFAAAMEPSSTAAALVFEHTWAKPFRDEIVGSGGVLLANMRVPGVVVDEVLAAVAEIED